jgi:hypothetical protein
MITLILSLKKNLKGLNHVDAFENLCYHLSTVIGFVFNVRSWSNER